MPRKGDKAKPAAKPRATRAPSKRAKTTQQRRQAQPGYAATVQLRAQILELRTLGRTLHRRRDDILAFFDHPGTSNGPSEAINGLLEHLRGTARGFRNIVNYIARSLLDAGGFRPLTHSLL